MRGRYRGPNLLLHGKTALLRWDVPDVSVLAQFDDVTLTLNGRPSSRIEDHLGFRWWVFPASEWRIAHYDG